MNNSSSGLQLQKNRIVKELPRNQFNSVKVPHNDGTPNYKHKSDRTTKPMSLNTINNTVKGQEQKDIRAPEKLNSLTYHPTNGRPIINPNISY